MQHQKDVEQIMMSASQIARFLAISSSSVTRLLRDAKVPAYRLSRKPGGTVRYKTADIEAFLEASRRDVEFGIDEVQDVQDGSIRQQEAQVLDE